MDNRYIDALNACSLESYDGYFEDLAAQGKIEAADLKSVEDLPVNQKAASYALAILACPQSTGEAKAYARELLHRSV